MQPLEGVFGTVTIKYPGKRISRCFPGRFCEKQLIFVRNMFKNMQYTQKVFDLYAPSEYNEINKNCEGGAYGLKINETYQ